MDERIRSILNGEPLIANREKWFSEMNDLFYGDRKGALHLAGMGGDAAPPGAVGVSLPRDSNNQMQRG